METDTKTMSAPTTTGDYEAMVKAGMHFGRKKTIFHPNMKPYIYTARENIYIMDLVKTSEQLQKAIDAMRKLIEEGKTILFVGTTRQSAGSIEETAQALKMPYVTYRWLGGTLTNFKVIISRVAHMEKLEKEQREGGFEKYTKKERLLKEREIENLRQKYEGLRTLKNVPDMIFVSSLKENALPVKEAHMKGIKITGIVNTDSDPKQLDYPIPANDNARKSVELALATIKDALVNVVPAKPAQDAGASKK